MVVCPFKNKRKNQRRNKKKLVVCPFKNKRKNKRRNRDK